MIHTGDNGRILGNIVWAVKKLLKVLKNFNKILTYLTDKENKW